MSSRRVAGWIALGLAGVLLAVVLTMAATELTSQRIGLQAEPLNAGNELVPERAEARGEQSRRPDRSPPRRPEPQEPADEPAPSPAPPPVVIDEEDDDSGSDDSGSGDSGHGDRGGGDDD